MNDAPMVRAPGMLLTTLEQLLAMHATDMTSALDQAAQLLVDALHADKIDVFLYQPETDTLVAVGVSNTAMGRRELELGLNRLPVSNGSVTVEVFETGTPYRTGRADQDPGVPRGFWQGLGIRSMLVVPLQIGGERRGVLAADAAQPEHFSNEDLQFLTAVAHWLGIIAHRADVTDQLAREVAAEARRATAEELVTVLAHDLRNYVTPLQARIDLVARRAKREERPRDVHDLHEAFLALQRIQRLINNLLDVGRLEQGIFMLDRQPIDLARIARETAAVLQTSATVIEVRAPDELCVDADPDRMRQAIENLVSNAVKHALPGTQVILTVADEAREDGMGAVVTVQDRGPGIASALLPHLFTRFAFGPGSTGLGLGLYLAHGIATAHGGTLEVESAPEAGATFRLSLPIGLNVSACAGIMV